MQARQLSDIAIDWPPGPFSCGCKGAKLPMQKSKSSHSIIKESLPVANQAKAIQQIAATKPGLGIMLVYFYAR